MESDLHVDERRLRPRVHPVRGLIETVHNENADQSITGASGGAATDDRVFALSETERHLPECAGSPQRYRAAPASVHASRRTLSVRGRHGRLVAALSGTWFRHTIRRCVQRALARANVDLQYGVRPACESTSRGR